MGWTKTATLPPTVITDAALEALIAGPTTSRDAVDARVTAGITGKVDKTSIDTDGTLAANSDTRVASQKATKTYVDQVIAAQDAMVFKGVIDCSTNPNYPAADRGWTYRVSVAGKIGGASGVKVEVGDLLLCLTDGTSAGTQAAVGSNWSIAQTNLDGAVIGPTSSTDNAFAFYSGTSGKLIQDPGVTLDTDATMAANSDTRIPSQKAVKTLDALKAPLPGTGSHPLTGMYHADGYGADKTGATDSSTALNTWMAALPNFSKGYLPPGTYLCNTVTAGVVLSMTGKTGVSLYCHGAIIKTTTAVATELFRVDNCPQVKIEDLELRVSGTTANITHGLHVTAPSPGSAEVIELNNVRSWSETSIYRNVWDITSAPGSNLIYSASAAFAAGDVGAQVTCPDSAMFTSTITAVATLSNTLSGAINASVTSIPLTGAISGAPTPEYYTVKIDNEIILVQTGGTTSTLGTCIRGYAGTTAASHSSGATVSTTRATLVANLNASGDQYGGAGLRITSSSSSILHNGISLGVDHPGAGDVDIADNVLFKCSALNCSEAGFRFGNGTNGNVINHTTTDCKAQLSAAGVYINGGAIMWTDGPCSNNLVDFKRNAGGAATTHIKGVRSEESGRFWDDSTGGTASPYVILEAIDVVAFHAADSKPIQHRTGGMISFLGMRVLNNSQGANTNVIFAVNGPAGNPAFLTAINVATTASTNPFGQYVGPPAVFRTLINISKVDPTSNAMLPSPFGNIIDDGIRVYERANGPAGVATLAGGTVTVANTSVTATSRIEAHVQSLGTVSRPQAVGVSARSAGVSFTLTSADATDTSVVYWKISEPAA